MKTHVVSSAFLLLTFVATAQSQQPQLPCEHGLVGEGQLANQQKFVNSLVDKLNAAYLSGDKKQEDDLVKQLEGYANHRDPAFTDEEKDKMEELAQRPEVKSIIEAVYSEDRAEEVEHSYRFNLSTCFFYPNPRLQDYVNHLGQSLVPPTTSQFYAFRIVNDPRPSAWSYSTGSIYVTTGLVSMLDNEAQLAFVLAHEIGHVERRHVYMQARGRVLEQLLEVEKIRSARKKAMILGAVAAGIGGAVGGAKGGGGGALVGATLGFGGATLVTSLVESLRVPKFTDYSSSQENEADEFAAHAVLEHNFDVREAPKVFLAVEGSIHRDDRVGGLSFSYGRIESLTDRRERVQGLLAGALKADLEKRAKTGLQASSPDWALLMSEVKRDNGDLALKYDLFDEARQNLEDAIAVRSNDPVAHLYLGQVYKLTARTPAEEQKAMDHFMEAIRLDTGRAAFPQPHLERALVLLKQNDSSKFPEAQKEIKTYIELYKVVHGGALPPNMTILYDYLTLAGDSVWAEPPVINVADTRQEIAAPTVEAKAEVKKVDVKRPK
jgi:predicted Zn-dependent protease